MSLKYVDKYLGGALFSGYTDNDKKNDNEYFILPKYSIESAEKDLGMTQAYVAQREQTKEILGKTPPNCGKHSGENSTGAHHGSTEAGRPANYSCATKEATR